jgi:teichuronic acid biosynthesis glycosyltransferase TuaC
MENICIITNKYPNPIDKNVLVFVQQLVWTMADIGKNCSVVCPVPINLNHKYLLLPDKVIETTENGKEIVVYFPKYIGFGQKDYWKFNPARITTWNFTLAAKKVIKSFQLKPDILYSHFVTPAGIASAKIGKELNIPAFMAHGEATLGTIHHYGSKNVERELSSLSGVVAVSTHNKNMLKSVNAVSERKIEIFPNGYRPERFYPRDKKEARKKFSLPEDKFIVCFVGSFDHRKGVQRLMKAIDGLDKTYAIFAGTGALTPIGSKCLHNTSVINEELPYFYSAADVFVLPTLHEGCCNAIIEAMACGLPIISSNLPFNDEILDDTNSIRVDPNDVEEIKEAIKSLYENKNRLVKLSNGSIQKSKTLTLDNRAKRIIKFIENKSSLLGE